MALQMRAVFIAALLFGQHVAHGFESVQVMRSTMLFLGLQQMRSTSDADQASDCSMGGCSSTPLGDAADAAALLRKRSGGGSAVLSDSKVGTQLAAADADVAALVHLKPGNSALEARNEDELEFLRPFLREYEAGGDPMKGVQDLCKDILPDGNCSFAAKSGYCEVSDEQIHALMKERCKASCGLCDVPKNTPIPKPHESANVSLDASLMQKEPLTGTCKATIAWRLSNPGYGHGCASLDIVACVDHVNCEYIWSFDEGHSCCGPHLCGFHQQGYLCDPGAGCSWTRGTCPAPPPPPAPAPPPPAGSTPKHLSLRFRGPCFLADGTCASGGQDTQCAAMAGDFVAQTSSNTNAVASTTSFRKVKNRFVYKKPNPAGPGDFYLFYTKCDTWIVDKLDSASAVTSRADQIGCGSDDPDRGMFALETDIQDIGELPNGGDGEWYAQRRGSTCGIGHDKSKCREGGRHDNDCCVRRDGSHGHGGCSSGYTWRMGSSGCNHKGYSDSNIVVESCCYAPGSSSTAVLNYDVSPARLDPSDASFGSDATSLRSGGCSCAKAYKGCRTGSNCGPLHGGMICDGTNGRRFCNVNAGTCSTTQANAQNTQYDETAIALVCGSTGSRTELQQMSPNQIDEMIHFVGGGGSYNGRSGGSRGESLCPIGHVASACRENGRHDADCCARKDGSATCASGYKMSWGSTACWHKGDQYESDIVSEVCCVPNAGTDLSKLLKDYRHMMSSGETIQPLFSKFLQTSLAELGGAMMVQRFGSREWFRPARDQFQGKHQEYENWVRNMGSDVKDKVTLFGMSAFANSLPFQHHNYPDRIYWAYECVTGGETACRDKATPGLYADALDAMNNDPWSVHYAWGLFLDANPDMCEWKYLFNNRVTANAVLELRHVASSIKTLAYLTTNAELAGLGMSAFEDLALLLKFVQARTLYPTSNAANWRFGGSHHAARQNFEMANAEAVMKNGFLINVLTMANAGADLTEDQAAQAFVGGKAELNALRVRMKEAFPNELNTPELAIAAAVQYRAIFCSQFPIIGPVQPHATTGTHCPAEHVASACRENGGYDGDCCARYGTYWGVQGSCSSGYTYFRGSVGCKHKGNSDSDIVSETCCLPAGTVMEHQCDTRSDGGGVDPFAGMPSNTFAQYRLGKIASLSQTNVSAVSAQTRFGPKPQRMQGPSRSIDGDMAPLSQSGSKQVRFDDNVEWKVVRTTSTSNVQHRSATIAQHKLNGRAAGASGVKNSVLFADVVRQCATAVQDASDQGKDFEWKGNSVQAGDCGVWPFVKTFGDTLTDSLDYLAAWRAVQKSTAELDGTVHLSKAKGTNVFAKAKNMMRVNNMMSRSSWVYSTMLTRPVKNLATRLSVTLPSGDTALVFSHRGRAHMYNQFTGKLTKVRTALTTKGVTVFKGGTPYVAKAAGGAATKAATAQGAKLFMKHSLTFAKGALCVLGLAIDTYTVVDNLRGCASNGGDMSTDPEKHCDYVAAGFAALGVVAGLITLAAFFAPALGPIGIGLAIVAGVGALLWTLFKPPPPPPPDMGKRWRGEYCCYMLRLGFNNFQPDFSYAYFNDHRGNNHLSGCGGVPGLLELPASDEGLVEFQNDNVSVGTAQ